MLLIQRIAADVTGAMKAREADKTAALRFVLSVLRSRQKEIAGQVEKDDLSDEEAVKVLQKEAKKRKEAIALYDGGGRKDLSEKENFELSIIQAYLPEEMSAETSLMTGEASLSEEVFDGTCPSPVPAITTPSYFESEAIISGFMPGYE